MGLITFLLLGAFTLLYTDKLFQKKPEFVDTAAAKVRENLPRLSMPALVYGVIAFILVPVTHSSGLDVGVRMLANLVLILMVLPFCFDRLSNEYQQKPNSVFFREMGNMVGAVSRHEKNIGIAGIAALVLLFAVMFR